MNVRVEGPGGGSMWRVHVAGFYAIATVKRARQTLPVISGDY